MFRKSWRIEPFYAVLGILPPGKFPPERSTPVYSPKECSLPTFFRFIARFARVRIEDSSRNRFASMAYFAKKPDNVVSMHTFHGGNVPGVEPSRGNFLGGEYSGHRNFIEIQ